MILTFDRETTVIRNFHRLFVIINKIILKSKKMLGRHTFIMVPYFIFLTFVNFGTLQDQDLLLF